MFTSSPEAVDVLITLIDDEPPIISNTSSTQNFTEEGGAISLFDPSVTVSDADNRMEDRITREVTVRLENPVVSEDQLIVNGSVVDGFYYAFSCDQLWYPSCYEEFLTSLAYNNTNPEPGSFRVPRNFVIQVRYDIYISFNLYCVKHECECIEATSIIINSSDYLLNYS